MTILLWEGKISGPAFCDEAGELVESGAMHKLFIKDLTKVNKEQEDPLLCDSDQVWELYTI